jgi:hypothetical protein
MARKAPKNNSIMDSSDFSDTPTALTSDTPAALNQAGRWQRKVAKSTLRPDARLLSVFGRVSTVTSLKVNVIGDAP